jgi:hypothetical protein
MKAAKSLLPIARASVANQDPHAKNWRNIITESRMRVERGDGVMVVIGR